MIKEIKKSKFDVNFYIPNAKFYYDEGNNEYYLANNTWKCYFNSKGIIHRENKPALFHKNGGKIWKKNGHNHRLDGPAMISSNNHFTFFIENNLLSIIEFANKSNHLICNSCNYFCKQECF